MRDLARFSSHLNGGGGGWGCEFGAALNGGQKIAISFNFYF